MRWALFCLATFASAHDITTQITWSREVSRLMIRHCVGCHAEFKSYQQAKQKAAAIGKSVLEHTMPPSEAVKGFGDIRNDGALTQEQIELVTRWVQAGAPEGDPSLAPKDGKAASIIVLKVNQEWTAEGNKILDRTMTFTGIRPTRVPGDSVKVVAREPDGTLLPLIWLYRYDPKFPQVYFFRQPITLPAGTKILISAPQTQLALLY